MKIIVASRLEGLDRNARLWRLIGLLKEQGHKLYFTGSGRGFGLVEETFEDTFSIVYKRYQPHENPDDVNWRHNSRLLDQVKFFQPDAMILDGEEFAAYIAQKLHIPIISIDPLHMFPFSRLDLSIPPARLDQLVHLKKNVRQRRYTATKYLLPSFFTPQINVDMAHATTPLTRPQVDTVTGDPGDHFAVFAWPHIKSDLDALQQVEQTSQVYIPMRKSRSKTEHVAWEKEVHGSKGNLRRRRKENLPRKLEQSELEAMLPNNERYLQYAVADNEPWLSSLHTSKATVMDGELTAIAESIALRKPMLLVPHPQRFDQWCYAHYIEKMGLGEVHPKLTKIALEGFLSRLDRYQEQMDAFAYEQMDFADALEQTLAQFKRNT